MNKIIYYFVFLVFFSACHSEHQIENQAQGKNESRLKHYYTCSMHPHIKEEKPGKCPICHMNLTKIEMDFPVENNSSKENEREGWHCKNFPEVKSKSAALCPMDGTPMIKVENSFQASKVVGNIKLRKAQLSHFKPAFFPVTHMKMVKKVRLLGSVLQSEEKESNVPARINGRVEKVYVKSTGSFVKSGDPVVDIYSPRLISAGEEFLLAKENSQKNRSKEFQDLLKRSIERLKLWGIKKFQLDNWYKSKNIPRQITIYSNATGIVRKRNAVVGKYFKEGQNFFELSDLSAVWIEMDVYEQDSSLVRLGQKVDLEFSALPGVAYFGEIDFVGPTLDIKSRTLKVRATIENTTGKLKPGMIASAVLNIKLKGEPLVVPRSAIIDTGKRKVVWIKGAKSNFKAIVIHSGYESQGYVEIKHGLKEGDEVVIEGNFLLDAQAQLFGGYEDMVTGNTNGHNH